MSSPIDDSASPDRRRSSSEAESTIFVRVSESPTRSDDPSPSPGSEPSEPTIGSSPPRGSEEDGSSYCDSHDGLPNDKEVDDDGIMETIEDVDSRFLLSSNDAPGETDDEFKPEAAGSRVQPVEDVKDLDSRTAFLLLDAHARLKLLERWQIIVNQVIQANEEEDSRLMPDFLHAFVVAAKLAVENFEFQLYELTRLTGKDPTEFLVYSEDPE
ncbi:hypothetical protein CPLU01_16119 [Colletotrichum plurivorum]|uniref:Uncharacterized protein n=1 Tax=Colletotrichum plurivorum TaxID=2175906 RepID=A0A8H6IZM8_9PEZI|nr:hypothetical protein CPLU01_16119 [Colletotrichum plurivorum]